MVVIVIVAILAGFVTLNLNIKNTPKTIREQATRLGLLMQLASDQAIYSNQQLGLRLHPESYEFYILAAGEDGKAAWQIFDDGRLHYRPVDEKLTFKVDIAGIPIVLETLEEERASLGEDEVIKPHVMFLSNGEIQPDYAIVVADEEDRYRHRVFSGEELPVELEHLE